MDCEKVEGLIFKPEGLFLQKLVRESLADGKGHWQAQVIVEIGSYKGKSGCYIGSAKKPEDLLVCVDDFSNAGGFTSTDLEQQMKKCGVKNIAVIDRDSKRVSWRDIMSNAIKLGMYPRFAFLFIDGDHSYGGAKNDASYIDPMKIGGWVAFHDAMDGFPGVRQVVKEEIFDQPWKWGDIQFCGSIVAARYNPDVFRSRGRDFRHFLKYQFWKISGYYYKHVKNRLPAVFQVTVRKIVRRFSG
jgi:hypothetical protein